MNQPNIGTCDKSVVSTWTIQSVCVFVPYNMFALNNVQTLGNLRDFLISEEEELDKAHRSFLCRKLVLFSNQSMTLFAISEVFYMEQKQGISM